MSRVGVIFDSGDVLIRPVNGYRWRPPPAFFKHLAGSHHAPDLGALAGAMRAGEDFLDAVHSTPLAGENDERRVWEQYHHLLLDQLRVRGNRGELSRAITEDWMSSPHIEPFPWTVPVLRELARRDIPVVVLSDAWPSLRRRFQQLGLDRYIRAMVISGEEGITKPDKRVFRKAIHLLGLDASRIIFVDDYPDYVRAAKTLGLQAMRLRHRDTERSTDLVEIGSLMELLPRLHSDGASMP